MNVLNFTIEVRRKTVDRLPDRHIVTSRIDVNAIRVGKVENANDPICLLGAARTKTGKRS